MAQAGHRGDVVFKSLHVIELKERVHKATKQRIIVSSAVAFIDSKIDS